MLIKSISSAPAIRVMIYVGLLVQCVLCVSAASVGESFPGISEESTAKKKSISNNKRAESELLDITELSFLSSCDGTDELYEMYCDLYRNLLVTLGRRKQGSAIEEDLNNAQSHTTSEFEFNCKSLVMLLETVQEKQIEVVMDNRVMKEPMCENKCFSMDDEGYVHEKPLCQALVLGFLKLVGPLEFKSKDKQKTLLSEEATQEYNTKKMDGETIVNAAIEDVYPNLDSQSVEDEQPQQPEDDKPLESVANDYHFEVQWKKIEFDNYRNCILFVFLCFLAFSGIVCYAICKKILNREEFQQKT